MLASRPLLPGFRTEPAPRHVTSNPELVPEDQGSSPQESEETYSASMRVYQELLSNMQQTFARGRYIVNDYVLQVTCLSSVDEGVAWSLSLTGAALAEAGSACELAGGDH